MECYLLSEPKVRGYRKHMLSLWLNKGIIWVSEQGLVDQANTIRRNSWMNELEIEELERNLAGKEIGNLEEEEVAIIEEIAEVSERRQKDKLPALRDIPKKLSKAISGLLSYYLLQIVWE